MLDHAKFVLSKKVAIEQFAKVANHADIVSYSMKTNYEVGKVLRDSAGCYFSVHSIQAAELVKDKSKIWYFAQAWDGQELKMLFDLGIKSFVVDNENDLNLLMDFIAKNNQKINLLLRMRLKEHTIHTGKHYVYGFYSDFVNVVIPALRANKSVDKLGIHFHRKTQNVSEWSLKQELEQSLSKQTLEIIDYVNIGGGLPSVYKNFRGGFDQIFSKIDELRSWLNSNDIKMIIEPGRFIAAPAIKLVTKIKNIYDNHIIVNCSVFNSAMDTFVVNIRLLVEEEVEPDKGKPYTLKGCTPDSMDIFRYKVYLKNPKVGDTITFLNAGAYNFSTDFCLLPKLETKIVD